MAFTQFPHQQYFVICDNISAVTKLGYYNLSDATELKYIMATIFQRGVIVTPYQVRLNIYGNALYETPLFSSSWATISSSTLEPAYSSNWLGNIYFDFAGQPLNANANYYMAIETSGYTRSGDTFYLGVNLDWYSPVNDAISPTEAGARIRILGDR